jgi:TrmH family RNA methyltransferase
MSRGEPTWRSVLADIERALTPGGRELLGRYVIEGTRLHERALRAGVGVEKALVSRRFRDDGSERARGLLEALERAGCALHVVPDEALTRLTGGRSIGGVLGLVHIPAPLDLGEVLATSGGDRGILLVAADVEDPGNVGALVRTALASGALALIAVGISDPFHPRAVRTSMGSLFKLPIVRCRGLEPLLDRLGALGVTRLGALSRGGTPLPSIESRGPTAVVLGGEAHGLDSRVRSRMDRLVSVPMPAGVDSLSVNAAAAILLYELRRGG